MSRMKTVATVGRDASVRGALADRGRRRCDIPALADRFDGGERA